MPKMRNDKTGGVTAVHDDQVDAFKTMGFKPVNDDTPTDVDLRDWNARNHGNPDASVPDIRAAYEKVFPPEQEADQPPLDDSSQATGEKKSGKQSDDDKPKASASTKEK